jgi:hypothetical protein
VTTTTTDRVQGEYRGIRYSIGSRDPFPGVGWRLHIDTSRGERTEDCTGAFYDGCEDHPEGAYVWAETAVRAHIDQIHATCAAFDARVSARRASRG